MMPARFAFLTALLGASVMCSASDKNKFYAVHDETCKQYLNDRSSTAKTLPHVAWLSGYISAYNRLTPDTYDIASGRQSSDFIPWLDSWCRSNPDKSLGKGMEALTSELAAKRRRSK
jgi:hypothetical protein